MSSCRHASVRASRPVRTYSGSGSATRTRSDWMWTPRCARRSKSGKVSRPIVKVPSADSRGIGATATRGSIPGLSDCVSVDVPPPLHASNVAILSQQARCIEGVRDERMRPFRFMVGCRDVVDRRTLAERARWAEAIGCSHVCIHDHLASQHAPIPLLTAVAMATERLRLCPLVFNNDLRHPAVLAPELASLDILSGGGPGGRIRGGWEQAGKRPD